MNGHVVLVGGHGQALSCDGQWHRRQTPEIGTGTFFESWSSNVLSNEPTRMNGWTI